MVYNGDKTQTENCMKGVAMKVLVTGATGFLGKYVVEELAEQGYQVRAFGRNLKAGRQLEGPLVEFFAPTLQRQHAQLFL